MKSKQSAKTKAAKKVTAPGKKVSEAKPVAAGGPNLKREQKKPKLLFVYISHTPPLDRNL